MLPCSRYPRARALRPRSSTWARRPRRRRRSRRLVADVNDFFPHGTTIHVGDSVKFVPTGFHTVDIPAKGGKPLGLIAPAGTTSGVVDAAGAPFWFNGQPTARLHPGARPARALGKKLTYSGAKRVESGLPLAQKPKPLTVKFTKTGTFTYYCNIHAGMKGTVKVVSKSHSVPSAKADAKTLKAQVSSALSTAKALTKTKVAPGNVSLGASGPRGVESFAHVPRDPDGPGGHDDQVLDVGQDLRGPHGHVRPRQPRDRAEELPRRPGERTSPTTRCSPRRPSIRAIRRRPVRRA